MRVILAALLAGMLATSAYAEWLPAGDGYLVWDAYKSSDDTRLVLMSKNGKFWRMGFRCGNPDIFVTWGSGGEPEPAPMTGDSPAYGIYVQVCDKGI